MTMITDPDQINTGTETNVIIDKDELEIEIVSLVGSALTNDGITGQALYSFLKEEWKNTAALIPYPFPMISITPEQFEFVNGWKPKNESSRNLLRSCGWREISAGGTKQREYMGIMTLGSIGTTNTAYYEFGALGVKIPFSFTGNVNQGIKTYHFDAALTPATVDNTADSLNLYIRTRGQKFDSSSTASIGLTGLNYIANRFPLTESVDPKITATDVAIGSTTPFTNMSIQFSSTSISKTINGTAANFNVIVHAATATLEQVYDFIQFSLRQNTDIGSHASSDAQIGALRSVLALFVGTELKTSTGVFIDNHDVNDTNRIIYVDESGTEHQNAFIATGNLLFNDNLVSDSNAVYRMFFTTGFGTSTAILVNDNNSQAISGVVAGASLAFTYDYDNNVQQGNAAPAPANVTVVAIGLDNAQYVRATATITRSVNQNISLVAPLERNYTT